MCHRFVILLLVILGILFTKEAVAESISPVYRTSILETKVPLGKYLMVFEDKTHDLHLGDMLRSDIDWKPIDKVSPSFGYSKSAFWFKLVLVRGSESTLPSTTTINPIVDKNYLLEIGYPLLDEIEFYSPYRAMDSTDSNGLPGYGYNKILTGDKYPLSTRPFDSTYFVFPVQVGTSETTYFIRVISTSSLNLPIILWQESSLRKKDRIEAITLALYYGIFIAIFLYNFLLFFMTRESILLLYCSAILTYAIVSLSLNGYGSYYFWSGIDWLRDDAPIVFTGLTLFTNMMYCYFFLLSKVNWSAWQWRLVFIISISSLSAGFSILFLEYSTALRLVIYAGIIPTTVAILAISYTEVYKRVRLANFYALGFTGFLIGTLFLALRNLGFLPPIFVFNWGQQIGSAFEMLVFSLGVGYKINQKRLALLREKDQAELAHLQEKTLLLDSVSRFVPSQFIKILGKENVSLLNLGDSIETNMTVLFSDIRDFTRLSETMSSEHTFRFVNAYLKRMGPLIQKHRGFIDKFLGDAIMALFADDRSYMSSSENAVSAALAMRAELVDYNLHREKSGHSTIGMGIGLNTGTLMLGTIGSLGRLDTTVIGDTVNLCSRIESLTKVYGVDILISDSVLRDLSAANTHLLREIDSVVVKGKTKPVVIYEIFDCDPPEVKDKKQSLLSEFSTGLVLYKTTEFQDALSSFQKCLTILPEDTATQLYITRCQKLLLNPPGSGWRGVVKLESSDF